MRTGVVLYALGLRRLAVRVSGVPASTEPRARTRDACG
jgi:hypothetical protein